MRGIVTHQSGLLQMKLLKKKMRMVRKNACFGQGLRTKKFV